MKKLFPEDSTTFTYKPLDGFVILVRDNCLYYQHPRKGCFTPLNGHGHISVYFTTVTPKDEIYVLPNEESLCATVKSGQCLEKYRWRPVAEKPDIYKGIVDALDAGKFVGYGYSDYRASVQKIKDGTLKREYKDTSKDFLSIGGANYEKPERFFVFEYEPLLWKWILGA